MYDSPYGLWEVTTEGDVEGRSTRHLGTFKGYVDELAFALADKCYYTLKFKPVKPLTDLKPTRDTVSVMVDIDSKTWDLKSKQRVEWWKELLKGRNVSVTEGNHFASVQLSLDPQLAKRMRRQAALDKLTAEDRKVLELE